MGIKRVRCCNVAVFVLLCAICSEAFTNDQALQGQRAPCGNEGERVNVAHLSTCFSCVCKNGLVECRSNYSCTPVDGCHMLVEKSENGCCQQCKGCMYKGVKRDSHTEWIDPSDPCKVMRCEAGVVTESDIKCHTPCSHPIPPAKGQCCPTCQDCKINGQIATDDRDVISDDPCLKCRCTNGRMTCSKKACPVLQCSEQRQHHSPGECCPRCTGTRTLFTVPKTCTLQSTFIREGQVFSIDRCTNCTCRDETSICRRNSCPILNCSPEFQKKTVGSCCKHCAEPEEIKSQCSYGGMVYEDGQSWQLDACSSCKCLRGMNSCARTRCNTTLPCAPGFRLVQSPGECCPKCVEDEGVCMVFGDPHYKTFDGKIYTFHGVGRYQLASDCHSHAFSVRVANSFHGNTRTSTLTKRVSIKSDDVRINLGQRLRVKVDGLPVELPYKKDGVVSIVRGHSDDVIVATFFRSGLRVLWNGRSLVEVTVPSSFKGKLCGLCGNFNGNVQDDFKVRRGGVVRDDEVLAFGSSWCVGQRAKCAKQTKQTAKVRPCKVHKIARNPCKYLTSTEMFNGCDSKLSYNRYYRACMADMCNCPDGKCYCDSLTAYAHECERLGVNMTNWEEDMHCSENTVRRPKFGKNFFSPDEIERILKARGFSRPKSARPPIPIE